MPTINLTTPIAAPIGRVFDLSRSIDLHTRSTAAPDERAIAGVTSGLIGAGEEVTWSARHLGVRQTLTSRITGFERPVRFTDTMVRGAFKSMVHHHIFEAVAGGCILRDEFAFESPLGVLGRLVDAVFLEGYMRAFLVERNRVIREVAESEQWRRYLKGSP